MKSEIVITVEFSHTYSVFYKLRVNIACIFIIFISEQDLKDKDIATKSALVFKSGHYSMSLKHINRYNHAFENIQTVYP